MGPQALRQFADQGLERGRQHGFESEWELVRYLDLLMALGRDLEEKPEYAEVTHFLNHPELNGPTRITRAYGAANDLPAVDVAARHE